MYTHPVWVPLLLCSTPGYSPRGNSTRGNALRVPQGNRATGCREVGRGLWRRGGGTYRQPLHSEARLGSTTGLIGPQAVGLAATATAENMQPLHTESRLGSVTGPSGPRAVGLASSSNLRQSGPPLSAVCWATLMSQCPLGRHNPLFWSVRCAMARAIRAPTP